ncbi:unnamed protein product [Chondrus crispus]|uniref:Uncharacterized protein n=1 Tax=Chondrus crispus TaxID=2769 RepID=R7QN22_CHOCR|nr:unnamed protein product [Chondrus crispus]CDF38881.1 unnamed protein product [Chondrus crispus]|eukprot:XP_005718786.1 unnamed protein product [Chondrus crispus]
MAPDFRRGIHCFAMTRKVVMTRKVSSQYFVAHLLHALENTAVSFRPVLRRECPCGSMRAIPFSEGRRESPCPRC